MKNDNVFPYYKVYLENRLLDGKLTNGSLKLMLISKSAFEDYKYRFESDDKFNKKQMDLYRLEDRDKKIDNLFDDFS